MAWDPPADALLLPDKPGRSLDIKRIRDLSAALAARMSGAPWVNGRGAIVEVFEGELTGLWTVPEGVTRIEVTAIGGGGGGGRALATNTSGANCGAGGGGGAGAMVQRLIEVVPFQELAYTIGAGGRGGGDVQGDDAEPGGVTKLESTVTLVLANAGLGGQPGLDAGGAGGAGGASIAGTGVRVDGATGATGWRQSSSAGRSGRGAGGPFGAGAPGRVSSANGYSVGVTRGVGGGGAMATSTGIGSAVNRIGGRGGTGLLVLRY